MIKNLPVVRGILRRFDVFYSALKLYIPPGHYYSPIVSQKEVRGDAGRIFRLENTIAGIDLNAGEQIRYAGIFKSFYGDFVRDYSERPSEKLYTPENGFYSFKDGIFLYCMMRHFQPRVITEIGSGFSSALIYDVAEKYLVAGTSLTFIEPYPEERLLKLFMNPSDKITIIKSRVQLLETSRFLDLKENDILFVDSSHVSKTGSDVNYILFDVLPKLQKGVIVHFHDIYYPFEYPKEHVLGSRWFSWNEAYILRAFLSNNNEWEIIFWNSYLENSHREVLQENFPLYFKGGSASIWIRKRL